MHYTQGNFSQIEDIDPLWFNILITFNTRIEIYRHQVNNVQFYDVYNNCDYHNPYFT